MPRPLASLLCAVLACAASPSRAQIVVKVPEGGAVAFPALHRPFPPLLHPLEMGTDAEGRARNIAATREDYHALRVYHFEMRVYVSKLRQAGRHEEAAQARESIETYKGYLKETRDRLVAYGEAPDRHAGIPAVRLLPLRPALLGVLRPRVGASPEEEAAYRSAAIQNAQRNIQALSEYQENLDDTLAVEGDGLGAEERAYLDSAVQENQKRLAEERALIKELGGDAPPPAPRAEAVGAKARAALEKAGGAPAKEAP
ncbi:MAG: hypothetical protein FD126_1018 [Elusimicrobia bacterium]|nr:MAG: hypothetical protein FD126_1018 [Elusimicrobiota bacterium]